MRLFLPLATIMVGGLAAMAPAADTSSCQAHPTRSCVFDQAVEKAERIEDAEPYIQVMFQVAALQEASGNLDEAERTLDRMMAGWAAREPDPTSYDHSFSVKCRFRRPSRDTPHARSFHFVPEAFSKAPEVSARLAEAAMALGDQFSEQAWPGHEEQRELLAAASYCFGLHGRVDDVRKVVDKTEGDLREVILLGAMGLMDAGEFDEAIGLGDRLAAPHFSAELSHIAFLNRLRTGDFDHAINMLETSSTGPQRDHHMLFLAGRLAEIGNIEAARNLARQAGADAYGPKTQSMVRALVPIAAYSGDWDGLNELLPAYVGTGFGTSGVREMLAVAAMAMGQHDIFFGLLEDRVGEERDFELVRNAVAAGLRVGGAEPNFFLERLQGPDLDAALRAITNWQIETRDAHGLLSTLRHVQRIDPGFERFRFFPDRALPVLAEAGFALEAVDVALDLPAVDVLASVASKLP